MEVRTKVKRKINKIQVSFTLALRFEYRQYQSQYKVIYFP